MNKHSWEILNILQTVHRWQFSKEENPKVCDQDEIKPILINQCIVLEFLSNFEWDACLRADPIDSVNSLFTVLSKCLINCIVGLS